MSSFFFFFQKRIETKHIFLRFIFDCAAPLLLREWGLLFAGVPRPLIVVVSRVVEHIL